MSTETKQAEWAMAAANELLDESRESSWYLSAPEIIAAIIAKHAQTPGVDERLLAIAKIASSEIELGTLRDRFTKSTLEQLLSAIAAAESTPALAGFDREAITALRVLANIADAYDANELDDGARKFWGANDEHQNCHAPSRIELYQGQGGKRLLTLEDCMKARAILARHDKK